MFRGGKQQAACGQLIGFHGQANRASRQMGWRGRSAESNQTAQVAAAQRGSGGHPVSQGTQEADLAEMLAVLGMECHRRRIDPGTAMSFTQILHRWHLVP